MTEEASKCNQVYRTLLKVIVHKEVPKRPARTEPRVRKRRPKSYPLMQSPVKAEGRRQEAEGMSPLPTTERSKGMKPLPNRKFGSFRLGGVTIPFQLVPSALCPLPPAFLNSPLLSP